MSKHRFIVLGSNLPFETLIELNRIFCIFSQEPIAFYRVFYLCHWCVFDLKREKLRGFPRKWSRAEFPRKLKIYLILQQKSVSNWDKNFRILFGTKQLHNSKECYVRLFLDIVNRVCSLVCSKGSRLKLSAVITQLMYICL